MLSSLSYRPFKLYRVLVLRAKTLVVTLVYRMALLSPMRSEMSLGADLRNISGNRRESMKYITQKLCLPWMTCL